MAKTKSAAKHEGWRLSKRERFFYYTGDIARLFCQALLNTFMTVFRALTSLRSAELCWQ